MYIDASDTTDWTVDQHIAWMRQEAQRAKMMLEVRLNLMLTTWIYYDGISAEHDMDLAQTTNKYRAMGVIK